MSANYLLWYVFGPSAWLVWLPLLAGLGLVLGTRRGLALAKAAIFGLVLWVTIFAILPTGDWLISRLEAPYLRAATPPSGIESVVVLAGGEDIFASARTGALELGDHGQRVTEALTLAQHYPQAKLWIVGGVAHRGHRDVDWVANYWRRTGLPAERIGIIGGTHDTCANADGIAKVLPGKRVLLVTSGFHMPRAMACMAAAGVDAVPYAADRQSGGGFSFYFLDNIRRADLALHEYAGFAWYRLTGRL